MELGYWIIVRARKRGVRFGQGAAVVGAAVLGSSCASASSSLNATPTMTPTPVPVLGKMTFEHFPSTADGVAALELCEGWAQVRGQYVANVTKDTPLQLDIWFSETTWSSLFGYAVKLGNDVTYARLTLAFSQVSAPTLASIPSARNLDAACAGRWSGKIGSVNRLTSQPARHSHQTDLAELRDRSE